MTQNTSTGTFADVRADLRDFLADVVIEHRDNGPFTAAAAILHALNAKGYAVVPIEPTQEMTRAARWALEQERGQAYETVSAEEKHAVRWRAMLKAAGAIA